MAFNSKGGAAMREAKNVGVAALKRENLKLQHRIANLEAQLITTRNRIKALEKERSAGPGKYSELEKLSDAQKLKRINELERKLEQLGRK
jgi:predicted nuclease with TOPRIM domain